MLRYAITNAFIGPLSPAQHLQLMSLAAGWSTGSVDFVQLRQKAYPPADLAQLARGIRDIFQNAPRPPRLLINSRVDIAVAVQADGVHLTASPGELEPGQVRALYAAAGLPEPVVSVSCHTLKEIGQARTRGASLILFGPIFEKQVAGEQVADGIGLNLLQTACLAAGPIPVLALGGVTEHNAAGCLGAGAAGIAAIRLFEDVPKWARTDAPVT